MLRAWSAASHYPVSELKREANTCLRPETSMANSANALPAASTARLGTLASKRPE